MARYVAVAAMVSFLAYILTPAKQPNPDTGPGQPTPRDTRSSSPAVSRVQDDDEELCDDWICVD